VLCELGCSLFSLIYLRYLFSIAESLQGTLKGLDHQTTIVLTDCRERIFSEGEGVEEVALGLYIVRGDQICCIGTSGAIFHCRACQPRKALFWSPQRPAS